MLKLLSIGFIAMQAVDSFLTLWATNNGATEVNPLMAGIAHTWAGPAVKLIPAALAVWLVAKVARRYPVVKTPATVGLGAAVLFLVAVTVSNITEL